jgi:protein tyrosine phosphatase (PTP) superfamily phosphohydrolase (DUF442 family)
MYRSSQPTMYQLERDIKKYGIKTILNLKGANKNSAYYAFEKEKCEELGIKMVDIEVYSRAFPDAYRIEDAKKVFESIEYPAWMHCKAGADRTGIYATLFQYFHEKMPISKTNQLKAWPFGHIKHSNAGKIDYYFDEYLKYEKENSDADLIEWANNVADIKKFNDEFKPESLASFLNDKLLRRE